MRVSLRIMSNDVGHEMDRAARSGERTVTLTPQADGRSTRVELWVDGHSVSGCWIVSQRIRIGRAVVRMDGIGGVGTEQEHRNRGYAREVLETAVRRMEAGDAGLSMLYGIPNFYEKFGYVQAGPEYFIELRPERLGSVPPGWQCRMATLDDMPALRRVYEKATADAVGAAVRTDACYAWRRLQERLVEGREDVCAVAVSPSGVVRGYARRGEGYWAVEVLERDHPEWWFPGEAIAADADAAAAVLSGCIPMLGRAAGVWPKNTALAAPHDSVLAEVATRWGQQLRRVELSSGGSMARIVSLGRLFEQLSPELERRLRDAGKALAAPVVIATEREAVRLEQVNGSLRVCPYVTPAGSGAAPEWRTAATHLVRCVLGVDVPSGLDGPLGEVLAVLFPARCPHMYLPDRY